MTTCVSVWQCLSKIEEAYSDKAQTERKLTEVLTKLAEYKVRLEFL